MDQIAAGAGDRGGEGAAAAREFAGARAALRLHAGVADRNREAHDRPALRRQFQGRQLAAAWTDSGRRFFTPMGIGGGVDPTDFRCQGIRFWPPWSTMGNKFFRFHADVSGDLA